MRTVLAILILFFSVILPAFSQGEIDDQEKIFYRNERTFGVVISTNGFGGSYRYAKRLDARKKFIYEIDFHHIKHEKEYRVTFSSNQQFGSSFVFGKKNSLFSLQGGIGLQKELFRKEDKGSISIRYFYSFGLSVGFEKPIYYDVITYDSTGIQHRERMKFEDQTHILYVEKKAPFYVGMEEIKIVPGAYGKFGFTFEFGKSDKLFSAIETGIALNAYIRKISIMANEHNHWIFPAFFLSYRFGKVIDAQFINEPSKIDKILTD
ncbi:MAG: hypothetical protein JXB24_09660 [Bacteroidales bacterium]|nr:hypothetical protein [Bacteroidales bacterium]